MPVSDMRAFHTQRTYIQTAFIYNTLGIQLVSFLLSRVILLRPSDARELTFYDSPVEDEQMTDSSRSGLD